MDRYALFVDAGYLLSKAGLVVLGTESRRDVYCEYEPLITSLCKYMEDWCRVPLFGIYWYDGSHDGLPTPLHHHIAKTPRVTLRLGRMVGEPGGGFRQKQVDTRLAIDVTKLAMEKAFTTLFLLAGDEDHVPAIEEARTHGVKVICLVIPQPTADGNTARNWTDELVNKSDGVTELSADYLRQFIRLRGKSEQVEGQGFGGGLPSGSGSGVRRAAYDWRY